MARNQRIFDLVANTPGVSDITPNDVWHVHFDATTDTHVAAEPAAPPITLESMEALVSEYRQRVEEAQRQVARVMHDLLIQGHAEMPDGTFLVIYEDNLYIGRPSELPTYVGFPELRNARVSMSFIGQMDDTRPVIPVLLDECWKCQAPVPKDDDFGLCSPCRQKMENFVDEPTPVNPVYTQELYNDLGFLPTDTIATDADLETPDA